MSLGMKYLYNLNFNLLPTLIMLGVAVLMVIAYSIRVALKGRAHFDRVDRQGGSALLGKGIMEMAYWCLQPFARMFIFFNISANMITLISLFLGMIAGGCLALGYFGSGAVFAALSALLDAMDGLVARLEGSASKSGAVFDSAVDRYTEFFFLAGLVIYYREIPLLQLIALFAFLGAFMVAYSTAKSEAMHVQLPKSTMRRPERAFYLILGAALCPVTIPIFEVYREFSIPIGHPMVVALCLVSVLSNVTAVERFMLIGRAATLRDHKEAMARQRLAQAALVVEDKTVQHQLHHP